MFFKKRRVMRSISKQLLFTNALFVVFMLVIFVMNYFFVLKKEQADVKDLNIMQQSTIREKLVNELERVRIVCGVLGNDDNVWQFHSMTEYEDINKGDIISGMKDKISLTEKSFPYNIEFYVRMNNSEKIISKDGLFNRNILQTILERKEGTSGAYIDGLIPETSAEILENENYMIFDDSIIYNLEVNSRCAVMAKIYRTGFEEMLMTDNTYDTVVLFKDGVFAKSIQLEPKDMKKLLKLADNKNVSLNLSDGNFYAYTTGDIGDDMKVISLISQQTYYRMKSFIWEWLFVIFLFVAVNILFLMQNINIYKPIGAIMQKYEGENKEATDGELTDRKLSDRELRENKNILQKSAFLYLCGNDDENVDWATVKELTKTFGTMIVLYIVLEDDYGNKSAVGSRMFAEKLSESYNAININAILKNADVYLIDMGGFNDFYDELHRIVKEVKSLCDENVFVTGGVSMLFDDVRNTYKYFKQSETALESQLIKNMNGASINVYEKNPENKQPTKKIIDIGEQNMLLSYLRNGNIDGINKFFDEFLNKMSNVSFADARETCKYLINFLNIVISVGNTEECNEAEIINIEKIYNKNAMIGFLRHKFLTVALEAEEEKPEKLYGDIRDYIAKHYQDPLSLDSIAELFNITPSYLSTYFKKHAGVNISHHIMEVRMQKAAELLCENKKMKINEIAEAVGIPSSVTFNRSFKKYFDMQPREYRLNAHNNDINE